MKTSSTTMMVLGASFALAVASFACGGQGDDNDNGQAADVADTTAPEDTAMPGDEGNPGDVALDEGQDGNVPDNGAGDNPAVDETIDDTVDTGADDTTDDNGDGGPLDSTVMFEACSTEAGANTAMPWVSEFDIGGDMSANGWGMIEPQTIASEMWDLASSAGVFGVNTGRFALFMGEEGRVSRTGLYSDCVDTSACDSSGTVTLQWRMEYKHADPEKSVTLKLVGVTGTDLDGGEVIWTETTSQNIEYALYSVEVPQAMIGVNGIRFALVLEFPDESALVTESWSIDHFVMACGKPNVNVKTLVYACPEGDTECTMDSATPVGDAITVGNPVSVTLDYCANALVVVCGYDVDADGTTWSTYGAPVVMRDAMPSVQAGTLVPSASIENVNGCEVDVTKVAAVCGVPSTEVAGYFYCAADFSVDCDSNWVATWDTALVIRDELDPTGESILNSPLESLLPIEVTATNTTE